MKEPNKEPEACWEAGPPVLKVGGWMLTSQPSPSPSPSSSRLHLLNNIIRSMDFDFSSDRLLNLEILATSPSTHRFAHVDDR